MSYSQLVAKKSLIPKMIDLVTLDNWFQNSDSLEALLQQAKLSFDCFEEQVGQLEYLKIANQAEQLATDLVMDLSYGDLLQLLCENPWLISTEAEIELMHIFQEKLGKVTVASLIAVVICEHIYAELISSIECIV